MRQSLLARADEVTGKRRAGGVPTQAVIAAALAGALFEARLSDLGPDDLVKIEGLAEVE
jgi:hypothetical protein